MICHSDDQEERFLLRRRKSAALTVIVEMRVMINPIIRALEEKGAPAFKDDAFTFVKNLLVEEGSETERFTRESPSYDDLMFWKDAMACLKEIPRPTPEDLRLVTDERVPYEQREPVLIKLMDFFGAVEGYGIGRCSEGMI